MTKKENARSVRATTERAEGEKTTCRASISFDDDFNTPGEARQLRIADLLSHGAENGRTIAELERLTGWKNRKIRKEIEREMRSGTMIISDNKSGYFLTGDPSEAQRFTRSMRHRAHEILETAAAIEKGAASE